MNKTVLGYIMMVVSVWVGTYIMYTLPNKSWMIAPTFLTTYGIFIYGMKLAIFGEKKND